MKKITITDKLIAWMTLLSGLSISAVAVYYSVVGLTAIFAAAVIPIIVMGIVLETGKLVATVWLKHNWSYAPHIIKAYLLVAVMILMMITSMGIFGYLSKAHLDQGVPTGNVSAQIAVIDEKIKTQRENIESARKALKQMDATVDETISRSKGEQGAVNANAMRTRQAKERAQLATDITKAQTEIAKLNEQRAPIATELRKVEAEVGPIKYIAAMIYDENPNADTLERAVRLVIIIIVAIFDPLAVVLLLASQFSFAYFRRQREENPPPPPPTGGKTIEPESKEVALPEVPIAPVVAAAAVAAATVASVKEDEEDISTTMSKEEEAAMDALFDDFNIPASEYSVTEAEIKEDIPVLDVDFHLREYDEAPKAEEVKAPPSKTRRAKLDFKPTVEIPLNASINEFDALEEIKKDDTPEDELDKVYKQATSDAAKQRRTKGWLNSSLPTKES